MKRIFANSVSRTLLLCLRTVKRYFVGMFMVFKSKLDKITESGLYLGLKNKIFQVR